MNNKSDKLICEGVENYIRSQIPSIAKNLHEAFGKGFLKRAGMLAREKILDFRARRKLNLTADVEARRQVVNDLHGLLVPHLKNAGINPALYKSIQQHPTYADLTLQQRRTGNPPTNKQLELAQQRHAIESAVQQHARFNPEMGKILTAIDRTERIGLQKQRKAASQNDPSKIGSLAYRANQLRTQREALRQQRVAEIPLEYSQYAAPTRVFTRPPSAPLSLQLAKPGARNLLVRSMGKPSYRVRVGGPGGGGVDLVDPNIRLTGIGRLLSNIETII